jgi:hypothetical protein
MSLNGDSYFQRGMSKVDPWVKTAGAKLASFPRTRESGAFSEYLLGPRVRGDDVKFSTM